MIKNPRQWLAWLQQRPYKVRLKILWTTMAVVAIGLLAVFALSLQNELGALGDKPLVPDLSSKNAATPETTTHYISVESVQTQNNLLKIYFKIENTTGDILNFSKTQDVQLEAGGQSQNPARILDRQNSAFVQKVLSHTTNFGVLYFSPTDATTGRLTFDQLYFEQTPQSLFKETVSLDFNQLKKSQQLRN